MIYVGDNAKRLLFGTKRNLTTAESWSILYEKPDGSKGVISDGITLHESGRHLIWPISSAGFFDMSGVWNFQARVVFDGQPALGRVAGLKVRESLAA